MFMKKILVLTDDFTHSSVKSGAILMRDLASAINATNRYRTLVLTPDVTISKTKRVSIDGIDTLLFPSGKLKNVNFLRRTVNETLLSYRVLRTYKEIRKEEVAGIIYYSPSIFFGLGVKLLKQKFSCSAYLILRDWFPQWIVDLGIIRKNGLIHLFFKYFESVNYGVADRIGVMSKSNLQLFENRQDFKKFEILPSWQKPVVIRPDDHLLTEFGLEYLRDKVVFFYGGNIGLAQGIDVLIDLAKAMLDENHIHFVFVGQGDAVKVIKNSFLPNVTYLNSLNPAQYYTLVENFDVGMVSLHPEHTAHNYPGKIWGYMSLQKPIVGFVNKGNDLKDLINCKNAGFISSYEENMDNLVEYCIRLSNDVDLIKRTGENSFNILLEFSPESTADQILSLFVPS
jgi:O26-antigen biosynthesis N-acetyl-L-fucosamine transferase